MKLDLPYVQAYRVKGKTYAYYRRGKSRLPIKGEVGTVAWVAEYQRIHASFAAPHEPEAIVPGSLRAVAAEFKASPEFRQLAKETRRSYGRYLDALALRFGDLPIATMPRAAAIEIRDSYAATPRTANYTIAVLSAMLTFAVNRGHRDINPIRDDFPELTTGDGHRPWEEFEVAKFQNRWAPDTLERVAFELLLNTGQRGIDVRLMAPQHYNAGEISVCQTKTRERLWIPASTDLLAILPPWLEKNPGLVMLASRRGKLKGAAFTSSGFQHMMRDAYEAAGLPHDCKTHGLRYTAATRLDELGCDEKTISAIVGHRTLAMVKKYTAKKRSARLAIATLDGRNR